MSTPVTAKPARYSPSLTPPEPQNRSKAFLFGVESPLGDEAAFMLFIGNSLIGNDPSQGSLREPRMVGAESWRTRWMTTPVPTHSLFSGSPYRGAPRQD